MGTMTGTTAIGAGWSRERVGWMGGLMLLGAVMAFSSGFQALGNPASETTSIQDGPASGMTPAPMAPLSAVENRVWVGKRITVKLPDGLEGPVRIQEVRLVYDKAVDWWGWTVAERRAGDKAEERPQGNPELTGDSTVVRDGTRTRIEIHPGQEAQQSLRGQAIRFLEGWFVLPKVRIEVAYSAGKEPRQARGYVDLEIADQRKAVVGASLAVLLALLAVMGIRQKGAGAGGRRGGAAPSGTTSGEAGSGSGGSGSGSGLPRILESSLNLTLTPMGTYSLSMTQVLLWTYLTLFGITYVWQMTEDLLVISDDVLKLLGIGSATAVLSRWNSSSQIRIPEPYRQLVVGTRTPRLSDLVSIDGQPSVFKFQMLVFTALSLVIVFKELLEKGTFPSLSAEMVTLMGVSSAAYLGNETVQREGWKEARERIAKIEAFARTKQRSIASADAIRALKEDPAIKEEVEALEALLTRLYTEEPYVPERKSSGSEEGHPAAGSVENGSPDASKNAA